MRMLLICGSRSWDKSDWIRNALEHSDHTPEDTVVVHGGADGADSMAGYHAAKLGFHTAVVYPLWNQYGKRAGFLRNQVMVEMAHEVWAFWDGESRGTKHTIDLAREAGIPVLVWEEEEE